MTPDELEAKFKAAEVGVATGSKSALSWGQGHPNVVLVLAGVLIGLVLGFMLFR